MKYVHANAKGNVVLRGKDVVNRKYSHCAVNRMKYVDANAKGNVVLSGKDDVLEQSREE